MKFAKACIASAIVSSALAFQACAAEGGAQPTFKKLGAMIDVSRGRVLTVDYLKGRFERMAKMGYNAVMLYTEETYKLEGVPKWGYIRGGYTLAEAKEIAATAQANGLELVPCIQTLGHLEQWLRWPDSDAIRCTKSTLVVGDERTYELIDKMVAFWQEATGGARRIHVGMDEAVGFWEGEYAKRNGKRERFDIFVEHLQRVCEICRKHGFSEVMIWSDMFYRMGSKTHSYYDLAATPSPELAKKIPPCVRLVYWNYYSTEQDFYEKMIDGHMPLCGKPVLAGGIQLWNHFLHNRGKTLRTSEAFLAAGRVKGCDEMWFTMWGDNGGYAIPALAEEGMFACAEMAAGRKAEPDAENAARFKAITGKDYAALVKIGELDDAFEDSAFNCEASLFYDDPMYFVNLRNAIAAWGANAEARIARLRTALENAAGAAGASSVPVADAFVRTLQKRFEYSLAIMEAWKTKDPSRIAAAKKFLDEAVEGMRDFCKLYREDWYATSQPFGFERMQNRNAAALARLEEAKLRMEEYLSGRVATIPEFDEAVLPYGKNSRRSPLGF